MSGYKCSLCKKEFKHKNRLKYHVENKVCQKKKVSHVCTICKRVFTRSHVLKQHQKAMHSGGGEYYFCGLCNKTFKSKNALVCHRKSAHPMRSDFTLLSTAHKKAFEVYRLHFPDQIVRLDSALEYANARAMKLIRRLVEEKKYVKLAFVLSLKFRKPDFRPTDENETLGIEGEEMITMNLRSAFKVMNSVAPEQMREHVVSMYDKIITVFDDFVENGSGWVLADCLFFDIEFAECAPLGGSCSLHKAVYKAKGVQIKESERKEVMDGERCFYQAIAAFFTGKEDVCSLEVFIKEQVSETISTPVQLGKIASFEKANAHLNIAINVLFKSEDGHIYPARASPNITAKNQINLLLFFTENNTTAESPTGGGDPILHYALIKDLGALLAKRQSDDSKKCYKKYKHFCFNCFLSFHRESSLASHIKWCHQQEGQNVILPEKGDRIEYEKKHKECKAAYTFFFDFETLQANPAQKCACSPDELQSCKHKSKVVTEHVGFAFSLLMINRDGAIVEDITYVGEDAMEMFVHTLLELNEKYTKLLKIVKPMIISKEQEKGFRLEKNCHICGGGLGTDRVRDHDHQSGAYIGAAHNLCNFKRVETKRIVGFAHNFSGYDSHLLIKALADYDGKYELSAIPLNTEKFKMLRVENCVLLDSMAFLNASLEKLVNTLQVSDHKFPFISRWLGDKRKRDLILRKGVYPYEYVTDIKRVKETSALPPRESFFSNLAGCGVSEEDYAHAEKVWKTFNCKSLSDYTSLYVKADTYQLAEAVIELRQSIWEEFNLDMCHYLSLPMLAKDIMLKTTGTKMELMSDVEMIHLVRSNIRGGLSYVNHRYFNVEEETERRGCDTSLLYVDANNLYGAAMRYPMPLNDFRWLDEDEVNDFVVEEKVSVDSDTGYMCEVTLDYPEELHELHSSFPLAPHQMDITNEDLSKYAADVLHELKKTKKYKAKKLTSTFLRREKYLCHGLNLKLYLKLGMKLVKIHRVISFHQAPFIKPYIDMCTLKRAMALTKTRADMYKLISNVLYGKVRYDVWNNIS